MANSHSSDTSPQRFGRGTPASELLGNVSFPLAVRGYDRRAVDEFLEELRNLVADLEAHQTREGVVQKALDELGEETAGILQRAHETADEIAARSRAQADGRLQRAEREAEIVKREADEYSEQVVADTRLLWDERQRLIEDVRHLADEVLATADDAIERLKLPEPLAADEQEVESGSASNVTPIPHPLSIARDPDHDRRSDPSIPYDLETPEEESEGTVAWGAEDDQDDSGATALWRAAPAGDEDSETTAGWRGSTDDEADDTETTARWRGSGEDEADDTETTARWRGSGEDEADDTETTARWRDSAADEDEEPETTPRWRGPAAADDDEPDTAEGWGVGPHDEDERDPDATVAWSAVDSDDPDATVPYSVEDEYDDDEPGAGAPPAGEPDSDEDPGHQTVELEALPGGNADDQAAESERKRD